MGKKNKKSKTSGCVSSAKESVEPKTATTIETKGDDSASNKQNGNHITNNNTTNINNAILRTTNPTISIGVIDHAESMIVPGKSIEMKENPSSNMNPNVRPIIGMVEKPRNVFLATACHYCKNVVPTQNESQKSKTLLRCSGCNMVKYCCKQHQRHDWKLHKPLCKSIGQFLSVNHVRYLYDGVHEKNLSQTEWLQMRYDYMQVFRDHLGRELNPFEKEILLFPLLCSICRRTSNDSTDLQTCGRCHGISFCSQHFKEDHNHCQELKIWMHIVHWENKYGISKPIMSKAFTLADVQINNNSDLKNFPATIQSFFSHTPVSALTSCMGHEASNVDTISATDDDFDVLLTKLTDIVTVPLSIAWALSKSHEHQSQDGLQIEGMKSLTIHLIGAECEFEGACSSKWEGYFMHLFPKLTQLTIVLVGPEIGHEAEADNLRLCSKCTEQKRQIRIEYINEFYHEYCNQSTYIVPNILCAFNCGLYRITGFVGNKRSYYNEDQEDSWKPTLIRLRVKAGCAPAPGLIIITEYTETEISQDSSRIQGECNQLYEIHEHCRNPFRSLRPQRALINESAEPLMYKNNFITTFAMR